MVGGRVNDHFRHASDFQIYEVHAKGRKCGYGEEYTLVTVIRAISD